MTAESQFATINSARLHYWRAGLAGPPVLLLHGGGTDSAWLSWRLAIEPLAQHHQVYAPDWPGYGLSDSGPGPHTTESYIDLVADFRRAVGLERASLVGISMGGSVALGYALKAPQHVDNLVLVDSYGLHASAPMHKLSYLFLRMPLINQMTWAMLGRSRSMTRAALQNIFHDPRALDEPLVDEVYAAVQNPGAGRAFTAWQTSEMLWGGLRTVYTPRMSEIKAPTLIVHGAKDTLVPLASAREAQRRIPGARLHVIEDCGHWPQREKPQEFNRVVTDFLSAPDG